MLRAAASQTARAVRPAVAESAASSRRAMSGTPHFPYPKKVWSPAGGWWPSPVNWQRNTLLAALGIAGACVPVFVYSSNRERRPMPPAWTIPSQGWCKHAKEDDPTNKRIK
jgi:hypothetical protein